MINFEGKLLSKFCTNFLRMKHGVSWVNFCGLVARVVLIVASKYEGLVKFSVFA